MGYGLEFWWLVMVNVTSRWQATEFLSHIPLRLRLALLLVRFAQPAKVRLRASHSAQNDRLVVCFAICVCVGVIWDAREGRPLQEHTCNPHQTVL